MTDLEPLETSTEYNEESIRTLDWKTHIRKRPGMYIGKLGDGSAPDDGIYILLKEVSDNAVDEFLMRYGSRIDLDIGEGQVRVRDYGRGIPLGKLVDVASKMNTGGKFDSKAFKRSVGLNGVGIKAVNALSSEFLITAHRDGQKKLARFCRGELLEESQILPSEEKNGTEVIFHPDPEIFHNFRFLREHVSAMVRHYSYLNRGLSLYFNGQRFQSKNGLLDLLESRLDDPCRYPIIHLEDNDMEMAITHGDQYGETYFTFVNGQYTPQGGSHLQAFREALGKTVRDFYKKDFDLADIRSSLVAAFSIRIEEPVFESQTKTRLGSKDMGPEGISIRQAVGDFVKTQLDNFLHRHPDTAQALLTRIQESEKERKSMAGVKKLARDRAKKANLHNRKLRDCRIHYNENHELRQETTLFITEGDSASGSITKSREVNTQAVFSLKGKPLNCFGMTKSVVYENEEFNLLQAALDIEDGLENLRYNNVVIATDADVDGMHIRLLLITFFLTFFPELVSGNHLYILQTPLFRVRNKKETFYCYNDEEKRTAMNKVGKNPEITRFKGLGEISPDEFRNFIGADIRLEPVYLDHTQSISQTMSFYMGKNTPKRQEFIIENLRTEEDRLEVSPDLEPLESPEPQDEAVSA
jgi:topoisomerase-4 subunit B